MNRVKIGSLVKVVSLREIIMFGVVLSLPKRGGRRHHAPAYKVLIQEEFFFLKRKDFELITNQH